MAVTHWWKILAFFLPFPPHCKTEQHFYRARIYWVGCKRKLIRRIIPTSYKNIYFSCISLQFNHILNFFTVSKNFIDGLIKDSNERLLHQTSSSTFGRAFPIQMREGFTFARSMWFSRIYASCSVVECIYNIFLSILYFALVVLLVSVGSSRWEMIVYAMP